MQILCLYYKDEPALADKLGHMSRMYFDLNTVSC